MILKTSLVAIQYKKLRDVFKAIESIPYANVKGEALSIQAYSDIGQRCSSDIDILLPREKIHIVEKILESAGFISTLKSREDRIIMLSSSHQVSPWIKNIEPWGRIVIDLNFDVLWGEYTGKRIDIEDFLSDTIVTDIYGCQVKILTPVKALVQLILHHYKEMNSIYHLSKHNCIKYSMFKDVYYLIKNNKDNFLFDDLYQISINYEIIPYVFYILYLTNVIFNDKELSNYVEAFRTDQGECLIDYYGLTNKERKLWPVDFKTRLEAEDLYKLIRCDLTDDDLKKIELNKRIFG